MLQASESTDVLVIGAGPAGLSLAFYLEGNTPVYTGGPTNPPHLQRILNAGSPVALQSTESLRLLTRGLSGRSENGVALLHDFLACPGADGGPSLPPAIAFVMKEENAVDYLVVDAQDKAGGSWRSFRPDVVTLSPGSWMGLPGCPVPFSRDARAKRADVLQYLESYPEEVGLGTGRLRFGTTVESVERQESGEFLTKVVGSDGTRTTISSRAVVLASGAYTIPKELEIPWPASECASLRSPTSLDGVSSVCVVGAGLSAADAVIANMKDGRRTLHVFRSFPDDDSKIGKFHDDQYYYPEYARLVALMRGAQESPLYEAVLGSITAIADDEEDNECVLDIQTSTEEHVRRRVRHVSIYVGSRADLSFLGDHSKYANVDSKAPLPVDPSTFEVEDSLYAIGPLAGDNFVRFITGHALGAVASIRSKTTKT